MERESFQSRIGFLLVSAGCAIGIGNVWRFPYICGEYGGGLFVLIYLLFLIIMGVPILSMELSIGRASKKTVYVALKKLEPEGSKWHIHGTISVLGNYILMMFYTVVSGWMLDYFFKFISGNFTSGVSTEQVTGIFGSMLANPMEMIFWMLLEVAICFFILNAGLQGGLEKVTKIMMGALLVLIIALGLNSIFLPGGMEGLTFLLMPSMDGINQHGLWTVVSAAMNQAFFTLSVGMGAMTIFGSYIGKDHSLPGESLRIAALDTIVAIMAG
ncbi:MAG: sodium-dependent transporter, partial [Anaerovibrio sp.]|uniref:sodium-dependent transporter n=1 Tax=Anaerovibrio sp. TaxID=1872532 RepID=UPI0025DA9274